VFRLFGVANILDGRLDGLVVVLSLCLAGGSDQQREWASRQIGKGDDQDQCGIWVSDHQVDRRQAGTRETDLAARPSLLARQEFC